jgi:hypothetical protein
MSRTAGSAPTGGRASIGDAGTQRSTHMKYMIMMFGGVGGYPMEVRRIMDEPPQE